MKADLQDLLYSDKWTPDAYLIARAYVPEDEDKHTQSPQYSTDTGYNIMYYDMSFYQILQWPIVLPYIIYFITSSFNIMECV